MTMIQVALPHVFYCNYLLLTNDITSSEMFRQVDSFIQFSSQVFTDCLRGQVSNLESKLEQKAWVYLSGD